MGYAFSGEDRQIVRIENSKCSPILFDLDIRSGEVNDEG